MRAPFLERSAPKMKYVFHFLERALQKNETRGPIFETDSMAKYVPLAKNRNIRSDS